MAFHTTMMSFMQKNGQIDDTYGTYSMGFYCLNR